MAQGRLAQIGAVGGILFIVFQLLGQYLNSNWRQGTFIRRNHTGNSRVLCSQRYYAIQRGQLPFDAVRSQFSDSSLV